MILVTGATGYIGGRLVPRLLEAGHKVRVLVRSPERLKGRAWTEQVEIAVGDVLKPETLREAMAGVEAAYYLIHGMGDKGDFHQRDLLAARNFSQAARDQGVCRIIYLGGLGNPKADLSPHLRSRQETGRALREAGAPVTEFRAAVIVGSGSLSFEMVRNLVERLPVMLCPQWLHTNIQPIAIRDVLNYLTAALDTPESAGRVIEIGGEDVQTYGNMMLGYAKARGLERWLIPVPVLTPSLSAYWIHWATPIPASIITPLIEGIRNEVVVRDQSARRLFPNIRPMSYASALRRALANLEHPETRWSDALGDFTPVELSHQQGMIMERRQRLSSASPEAVYRVFSSLGGERGWLYADWAWQLRGLLDRMIGGVGLRRGRRHPYLLRGGDALDFWRVETIEHNHLLRLRAEMKLPGQAWLQFEAYPEDKQTRVVQTGFFTPKGLFGLLYWYSLYPTHKIIFSKMIDAIVQQAERLERTGQLSPATKRTSLGRYFLRGLSVLVLAVLITSLLLPKDHSPDTPPSRE